MMRGSFVFIKMFFLRGLVNNLELRPQYFLIVNQHAESMHTTWRCPHVFFEVAYSHFHVLRLLCEHIARKILRALARKTVI